MPSDCAVGKALCSTIPDTWPHPFMRLGREPDLLIAFLVVREDCGPEITIQECRFSLRCPRTAPTIKRFSFVGSAHLMEVLGHALWGSGCAVTRTRRLMSGQRRRGSLPLNAERERKTGLTGQHGNGMKSTAWNKEFLQE